MKKSIMTIISFLIVALVAGSVFAWGPGMGRGMMGNGFNQACPGYGGQDTWNNLSANQRNELATLRQAFIDDTYQLRSRRFQKQQEIRLLMETSSPDRAKLDKLSMEMADLQNKLRNKGIDFYLKAKKISPELGMGSGYGMGQGRMNRGMGPGYGGHTGFHGQANGCYYNN